MERASKILFFMTIISILVRKMPISSSAIKQQYTITEKHGWTFECGKSRIPCDRRYNFCEERIDRCTACFQYCSDARIKGHDRYQTQCHKYCPVYMRDKENKRSRKTKLDNQTTPKISSTRNPAATSTTDSGQLLIAKQLTTVEIASIIVGPIFILIFCLTLIGIWIWKYSSKTKGLRSVARDPNTETWVKLLPTDGGRELRLEGSRQGSSVGHPNSDVANLKDVASEISDGTTREVEQENRGLVIDQNNFKESTV